jgi:hypothetical protein
MKTQVLIKHEWARSRGRTKVLRGPQDGGPTN